MKKIFSSHSGLFWGGHPVIIQKGHLECTDPPKSCCNRFRRVELLFKSGLRFFVRPKPGELGLDEKILQGICSALRVPQSIDLLVEELEPDVAAIALPLAINIALFDRQVNSSENYALNSLLQVMKQPATVEKNVDQKTLKHKLYWLLTSVIPRY